MFEEVKGEVEEWMVDKSVGKAVNIIAGRTGDEIWRWYISPIRRSSSRFLVPALAEAPETHNGYRASPPFPVLKSALVPWNSRRNATYDFMLSTSLDFRSAQYPS